ncbi:hypothetical protein I553_2297 [Mycobacterium xenopi 4042]|uniref:Uncharacterized protein n=1 Tax=Mycobacterium xenopi 4042 TaxID=1299334 RepID=X7ZET0_MYCXE|nr:hypothetical protein I553_2297 [Mycobacterium xenopi 4042]
MSSCRSGQWQRFDRHHRRGNHVLGQPLRQLLANLAGRRCR